MTARDESRDEYVLGVLARAVWRFGELSAGIVSKRVSSPSDQAFKNGYLRGVNDALEAVEKVMEDFKPRGEEKVSDGG